MIQWIKNLINLYNFSKDSRWFEKNPAAQMRFEDIEDWTEELEDRIIHLEELAHPKCGLDGFDGYKPLMERIEKLEVIVTVLKKENDDR